MIRFRPTLSALALGALAPILIAAPPAGQAAAANFAGGATPAGAVGGLGNTAHMGAAVIPRWEQAPISPPGDVALAQRAVLIPALR